MTTSTTEIIFLRVKSTVRPEDSSSEAGAALLAVLARAAPSFEALVWGRSIDKPTIIGIAVELSQSGIQFPLDALAPFQVSPPGILVLPARAADLVLNPVTEVAILPLRETLAARELEDAAANANTFGSALLAAPAPPAYSGKMALAYQCGFAEPSPRNRMVMLIGWREVQNHMDASETEVFQKHLEPIMKKVHAELDVTHFRFSGAGGEAEDGAQARWQEA